MPSAWKLSVTLLGAHDSAREVVVHGDNWLSALREGQRQLGEPGGVPPGASCAVAATGVVTLLDPIARRRYTLEPLQPSTPASTPPSTAQPLRGGPASHAPEASSSAPPALGPSSPSAAGSAPRPASTSSRAPASNAARPVEAIASGTAPESTLAASRPNGVESAAPSTPEPPPPVAVPDRVDDGRPESDRDVQGARRPKPTLDYSPERAEALRREYEGARARANFPSLSTQPDGVQGALAGAPTTSSARPSSRPPGSHSAQLPLDPFAPLPSAVRKESRRASSLPPPAAALRTSVSGPREAASGRVVGGSVYGLGGDGLSLLASRDLDPTPGSPLTYRERAYLFTGKGERVRLEVLLQAELAHLRRELAGRPRGQFVRLGVFAQPFVGTPEQPPLATLEWKDWRGRAQFRLTSDDPENAEQPEQADGAGESSSATVPATPSSAAAAPRESGSRPAAVAAPQPVGFDDDGWPSPATAHARSPALPPAQSSEARIFDLSEERSSEPDLRLASAFESMPELHLLATPLRGLEFTVDLLSRLVPCDAISACLYDVNTDEFRFVALSGRGAAERKASAVRASAGLFGAATRERGDALLIASSDPRFDEAIDGRSGLAAQSLAYVPVRHRGQLLGMLQLINRDLPGGFAQGDVGVLTYVASQLGEFLANCWATTD